MAEPGQTYINVQITVKERARDREKEKTIYGMGFFMVEAALDCVNTKGHPTPNPTPLNLEP